MRSTKETTFTLAVEVAAYESTFCLSNSNSGLQCSCWMDVRNRNSQKKPRFNSTSVLVTWSVDVELNRLKSGFMFPEMSQIIKINNPTKSIFHLISLLSGYRTLFSVVSWHGDIDLLRPGSNTNIHLISLSLISNSFGTKRRSTPDKTYDKEFCIYLHQNGPF